MGLWECEEGRLIPSASKNFRRKKREAGVREPGGAGESNTPSRVLIFMVEIGPIGEVEKTIQRRQARETKGIKDALRTYVSIFRFLHSRCLRREYGFHQIDCPHSLIRSNPRLLA
ncbi:hypothetical protein R6Q59_026691 [Mikania micrantha]